MSINLVKDWYLTQQCSQTEVKDCIISMSLISGILFCAVLLYLLVCGLFCSFLERRVLRTRTEKKPGKSCNWLCLSVLWQPTISPADDLQIPGRCVVESQRTGTRTTRSNCFPWNSIMYPPASCSPNLGHVQCVMMNWPTDYVAVNLVPHLTKHLWLTPFSW